MLLWCVQMKFFQENKKNSSHGVLAKEVAITEAKKLIRHEKFHKLAEKKKEIILSREIDQFRDSLQLKRNFCKLALDTTEELVLMERRHRQIRAASYKNTSSQQASNCKKSSVKITSSPVLGQTKSCYKGQNYCSPLEVGMNQEVADCAQNNRSYSSPCQPGSRKSLIVKKEAQGTEQEFPPLNKRQENQKDETEKKIETGNPTTLCQNQTDKSPQKKVRKKKEPLSTGRRNKTDFLKNYAESRFKLYYWSQWKLFVAAAKKKKEEERVWREKINSFMQRLNERTKHQTTSREVDDTEKEKKYRRKTAPAKTVKSAADGPRQQAQDKDLDEMAFAIAKSAAEAKQQLRAKSVKSLTPNLQGKAKLIRLITSVASKENSTEKQQIEFPLPETLKVMDRKHDERKQRLVEIHERKRRLEEEKDRIVREKYEQQLLEEEREKKRKVQEFREKLKKERMEQEKRKQEWIRMKALSEAAINHYNHKLITQFGICPWLRLVERRRIKNTEAEKQNDRRVQRTFFAAWKNALEEIERDKMTKALALRAKLLLRSILAEWRGKVLQRNQQLQVAEDWYDYLLVRKSFQAWLDFIYIDKKEYQQKWDKATAFYRLKVATKCLQHWMLLPQVLFLEREKEHRKKEWREKVQQVLPDFQPILQVEF